MLKVCLALPIFYPTFGGGSLRFLRYQPGLKERGIQSRVLAGTARTKDASQAEIDLGWYREPLGSTFPVAEVQGIPVHRVRLPDETGFPRTATYFKALIALCQDPATRPDVIQVHSFERVESLYWLRQLRKLDIPIVYAIQIARPANRGGFFMRIAKRLLQKRFYNAFDGVVTSSEQIAGYLESISVRTPITVIPNGVDLKRYTPLDESARSRIRTELGIAPDAPVIISVGAVSPRKGTDLLLEAWTRLLRDIPNAEIILVGPRRDQLNLQLNEFEARLEELAQRAPHPERVHYTDYREDLPELYAASDLAVLPTAREGGTPNVVLEAMACRRPVMITPFEGQSTAIGRPDIEFDQVRRDPKVMAAHMATLLRDPARMSELADNGYDWVHGTLDVERSIDQFEEFYRDAAERRLGAASR